MNASSRLREDAALTNTAWRQLKHQLYVHDWVVYAKQPLGGPARVIEFLGRYTHRVAISNERILGIDDAAVAFHGHRRAGRLSPTRFIRRHVASLF